MDNIKNFEEWRSEEVAKMFLLKSPYDLIISKYPTPLFDFFVQLKSNIKIAFAVEVKTKARFQTKINQQLQSLKIYRDTNMINIPVLIFKIDERNETGEIDFLVIPSHLKKKLLIRETFKFIQLNEQSLQSKIDSIKKWYTET